MKNVTQASRIRRLRGHHILPLKSENFFIFKSKVIIEKSRGEVSLMEADTIENVSQPIKNEFFNILYTFDTSKCATNYRDIFDVYNGFTGQKIVKL